MLYKILIHFYHETFTRNLSDYVLQSRFSSLNMSSKSVDRNLNLLLGRRLTKIHTVEEVHVNGSFILAQVCGD